MKTDFFRPRFKSFLVLLAAGIISFSASSSFGAQAIYGTGSGDGKPTDWDSPLHNAQIAVSQAQAARVEQDPGAAGGGEGRPTDWDSPKRFVNLTQPPYAVFPSSLAIRLLPAIYNLLIWWF